MPVSCFFVAVGLVAASAHSQGRESALARPRVRTHFYVFPPGGFCGFSMGRRLKCVTTR